MPNQKALLPARVRWVCSDCGARLFPSDSLERYTIAPQPGKSGNEVLLRTYNATHRDERMAYCFVESKWVELRMMTPQEVLRAYMNRKGVGFR